MTSIIISSVSQEVKGHIQKLDEFLDSAKKGEIEDENQEYLLDKDLKGYLIPLLRSLKLQVHRGVPMSYPRSFRNRIGDALCGDFRKKVPNSP